ncbi:hypothetical protein Tco_0608355 [Tanacetum coccineum]
MASFRLLHTFLQVLSYNEFKIMGGFERAFAALFDQDVQTFTCSMLLNLDQLEKQRDNEEFQETESMDAFRVLKTQFQMFINFRYYFDYDEGLMIRKRQFRKEQSINEKSSGTESDKQDTSNRSGNDTDALDADIRLKSNKEPRVDSNITPDSTNMSHRGGEIDQNAEKCQVSCPLLDPSFDNMTTGFFNQSLESENISLKKTVVQLQKDVSRMKAHCVNMELKYQNQALKYGVAKLLAENEHLKQTYKDLYDSIKKTRVQTKDHNDSLIAQINSKTIENADLKAQIQEKVIANVALKNELRKLKGNSVDTKFAKPSILGKPVLQPPRNQSVVRQPNAFKSERPNFSKPRFASQVDVNNVLSKPVTPHYLSKVKESVLAKPHHVIAPGSSRNSQEESYGSNDMAHNHYLEEARKKTQERNRNSKSSVMHTTSLQNTTNGSKQKPRSNNQTSRSLPVSKSSGVTSNSVPLVDHSRNSSSFSDSKYFVCSTCQKCVFNANHDDCITKFLKEVNSRVKVQSTKTRNSNKPVESTSHTQKHGRQIVTGHRFSPDKSSAVHEKTTTPRSCLRWIPTSRIFNTVSLKWVPTGKIFTSSTTKVHCKPPNGSNKDITNPYECNQTLNVSANNLNLSAGPGLHSMTPATSSSGIVRNPVSQQPFQEAAAPRDMVLVDSPVSTSIDQDSPSSSTPSTQKHKQSLNIFQGFEESPKTPIFRDDPLNESHHEESTSQGSSSNVRQTHTPFEHLGKWTKNHPIANVIGDPSCSVSTRKQLQTDIMWCYFDAFLTFVEPKNFKQAT